MSALPRKTVAAIHSAGPFPYVAVDNAMDLALGPDRLVVVGPYEQAAKYVLEAYMGGDDETLRVALNCLEVICGFSQQEGS